MSEPVVIRAQTCNGDTYETRYYRAADYDALQEKLSVALSANHDLRDERDRLTDRPTEADALLREATAELQWWIDNHPCCDGHQGDLMTRLRNADIQKSSVSADSAPTAQRGSLAGGCRCGSDGSPYAPCVCGGRKATDQP